MWQTKYASAVPKNLGVNFRPCSEGWASVVRAKILASAEVVDFCQSGGCVQKKIYEGSGG